VQDEQIVSEALDKAHSKSKRKGKWSTVKEVKRQQEGKASTCKTLEVLVKKGLAEKRKKPPTPKMYRPGKGAAGGASGLGLPGLTDRSQKLPGGDRSPENNWGKPDEGPRSGVGDTVGAGIGVLLVGGIGGASPATGGTVGGTAGVRGIVSGPM